MKKLSIALVAIVWAGTAFAGSYHRGTSLICSDCHTMHSSRSHTFGSPNYGGADGLIGTPTPGSPWLGTNGGVGHESLLVGASISETCLACHDGKSGIPDVLGTDINSTNTRPAGHLSQATDSVALQQSGHTIGLALTAAPPGWQTFGTQNSDVWTNAGRNFEAGLTCADCHSVHGAAPYRNLGGSRTSANRAFTGNASAGYTWGLAPTYQVVTAVIPAGQMMIPTVFSTDVVINASGKAVGNKDQGDNYDVRQLAYTNAAADTSVLTAVAGFNATSGATYYYSGTFAANPGNNNATDGKNKFNAWCGTCHGNFHSTSQTESTGVYTKHPTSGGSSGITMKTSSLIMGPTKNTLKPFFTSATTFEPGCVTCHKGHGTSSAFGIVQPWDQAALGNAGAKWGTLDVNLEDGDAAGVNGSVRNLCTSCHGQGRTL